MAAMLACILAGVMFCGSAMTTFADVGSEGMPTADNGVNKSINIDDANKSRDIDENSKGPAADNKGTDADGKEADAGTNGTAAEGAAQSDTQTETKEPANGKDVTIHFGNNVIKLYVNPEKEASDPEEAETAEPETEETEVVEEETEEAEEIAEAGKTFVYEDDKIRVTAQLQVDGAVPPDAEFRVTELSGDQRRPYLDALNANADEVKEATGAAFKQEYDDSNTLMYDVAFLVDKTDEEGNVIEGEKVEFQPKEGSVHLDFTFKKNQLTDTMGDAAEAPAVVHLPLTEEAKAGADTTLDVRADAKDVRIDAVESRTQLGGEDEIAFSLNGLSVVTIVLPSGYTGGDLSLNTQKNAFLNDEYAIYRNDNSCFGPIAGSFHVIAFDTAELAAHTNGNILAKNLDAGANFGTNPKGSQYINELSYIQNYLKVNGNSASETRGLLVLGSSNASGVQVIENGQSLSVKGLNDTQGTKLDKPKNFILDNDTSKAPFIDLEQLKEDVVTVNKGLSFYATQGVTYDVTGDQNKRYIEVTAPGAAYLNLTADQIGKYSSNRLEIKGLTSDSKNSLIVNIDCAGKDEVRIASEIDVYVDGKKVDRSETVDFSTGRVIWNFTNTTEKTKIYLSGYFGQIVAPNAYVEVNNGNGNIIANKVRIIGESHRHDFNGTVDPATLDLTFYKTVDGQVPPAGKTFTFALLKLKNAGSVPPSPDDPSAWEVMTDSSGKPITATSDAAGKISFAGKLKFEKEGTFYYKVAETEASAEGYIAPSPIYIKAVIKKTTGLDDKYTVESCQFYTNSSCEAASEITGEQKKFDNVTRGAETSITVTKKWLDSENKDVTKTKQGAITFTLYRKVLDGNKLIKDEVYTDGGLKTPAPAGVSALTDRDGKPNGKYRIESVQAASGSGWIWNSAEIIHLPLEEVVRESGAVKKYSCVYYIREDGVGLDATYQTSKDKVPQGSCTPITEGGITIFNKVMSYTLPATGGSGTRNIMLIGMALIALAGAGLLVKRKRA